MLLLQCFREVRYDTRGLPRPDPNPELDLSGQVLENILTDRQTDRRADRQTDEKLVQVDFTSLLRVCRETMTTVMKYAVSYSMCVQSTRQLSFFSCHAVVELLP